jgi:pSer/pThr/pTyr-binding forkhead associated (FHA) protein
MAGRVVIRHIGGTRIHQTDEFAADGLQVISAGRDEVANVRFDPQREDTVSREHLRITRESPGSQNYLLSDLNSRNGTFLNRQRISQPTRIQHLDVVQLGLQGPEFRFELDPPPQGIAKPTRVMDSLDGPVLSRSMPTRQVSLVETAPSRPIGRATVERMLGDTFGKVKKESNKTLWMGVAALVLITMVGVTTFAMLRHSSTESDLKAEQQQKMLLQMSQTVRQPAPTDATVKAEIEQINSQLKKIMAQNRALQSGEDATGQKSPAQLGAPVSSDPAPAGAALGYNEVFDRASQEYKSGNATAAYQDCASLITADGSRWEAYYLAGLSLIALQQPAQAASLFQYALQYAPESARGSITQQLNMAQGAQNSQQAPQSPYAQQ